MRHEGRHDRVRSGGAGIGLCTSLFVGEGPVNIAGYAAANILKGDVEQIVWSELPLLDPEKDVLIDLRNPDELLLEGTIPGSLHIPLSELRSHLPELDRDKQYVPFCAAGLRGYIAHRVLVQHGFR